MTVLEEREKFILIAKRILKSNLTTNPETLERYRVDIITAYNLFVDYIAPRYRALTPGENELGETYFSYIEYVRNKLLSCLQKLGYTYLFSRDAFEAVDSNLVIPLIAEDNQDEMAPNPLSKNEFITIYSKFLYEYDGSADKKQAFLDALSLVDEGAEDNMNTAVRMIKSKLIGKARSYVTDSDVTVQAIIDKLTVCVKSDSSDSLVAKMKNIKQNGKSATTYITEIEKLCNSLRTSFISEGMSCEMAEKHTTTRAVEAIKQNTHSNELKTIIKAGTFNNVNDLVGKFVEASNDLPNENSINYFRKKDHKNYRGHRNNQPSRGFNNNNRGNRTNTWGNSSNNYRFQRGNNHSRGNNRNHYSNGYSNNTGNGNYNRNRQVRAFDNDQGNRTGPQYVQLGDPNRVEFAR